MTHIAWKHESWHDVSDSQDAPPGNRLLRGLDLGDCSLHVEAIRVLPEDDDDPNQEQRAYNDIFDDTLNDVYRIYDYALETTTIDGFEGQFVIYAFPYGE